MISRALEESMVGVTGGRKVECQEVSQSYLLKVHCIGLIGLLGLLGLFNLFGMIYPLGLFGNFGFPNILAHMQAFSLHAVYIS